MLLNILIFIWICLSVLASIIFTRHLNDDDALDYDDEYMYHNND